MREIKDIREHIGKVVKTGKYILGSKETISNLLVGNPKIVILSDKCPINLKERILYYSRLSEVPCIVVKEGSFDLGAACGKPFPVSAFTVLKEGESNIMKFIREEN